MTHERMSADSLAILEELPRVLAAVTRRQPCTAPIYPIILAVLGRFAMEPFYETQFEPSAYATHRNV